MKILNSYFYKILIVISISLLSYFTFKNIKNIIVENNNREKLIINLNNCFDLENKNLRRANDSLKLIEFCMNKYGMLK